MFTLQSYSSSLQVLTLFESPCKYNDVLVVTSTHQVLQPLCCAV